MIAIEGVTNYFTPTVLFCIVTLLISTILMLNPHKRQPHLAEHQPQLYSVLDRVKSFKLTSQPRPDPVQQAPVPSPVQQPVVEQFEESHHVQQPVVEQFEESHHVQRSKSEHVEVISLERQLKKSFSERFPARAAAEEAEAKEVEAHRPATAREAGHEDEAVDTKADDFINRFRQQLKLQRLDSILRYKDMLHRRT